MSLQNILQQSGISQAELKNIVDNPAKFIEFFLKGLDKKSIALHPKQKEIVGSRHPRNVVNLHRRAGKSFSLVVLALYLLLTTKNCKILFLAPANSQIEVFFDEIDRVVEANIWIASCITGSTKGPYKRKFSNGAMIRGMTTGSKAKQKASAVRGWGANYIFIDEVSLMSDDDFSAIIPVLNGNAWESPPITFALSTPGAAAGQFFRWCTEENDWNKLSMTIMENPLYSDEERAKIRAGVTSREWQTEYMCEFLNMGDSVFNLKKLAACATQDYKYSDIISMPYPVKDLRFPELPAKKRFWRTMGVDWDKFNQDGSGPTIAILDCDERLDRGDGTPGDGIIRVVYRESIPQSEFCLTEAVKKIVNLNRLYNPDQIYCDAGLGEMQIETLHLYGKNHPETKLDKKVIRVQFSQNIDIMDPRGGLIPKKFKHFMVNLLCKWIEDETIQYPYKKGVLDKDRSDSDLFEQFNSYKIIGQTQFGYTYSFKNEHIIDAIGLAAVSMFQIHTSPFKWQIASRAIMIPPQEVIPGDQLTEEQRRQYRAHSPVSAMMVGQEKEKESPFRIKVELDHTPMFPPIGRQKTVRDMFNRRTGGKLLTGRRRASF